MTGEQRKKVAKRARAKLMREMDSNIEREQSLSRAGSRAGSRNGRRDDEIDINARQAGADFSMDLLSQKLTAAQLRVLVLFYVEQVTAYLSNTFTSK